MKYPLLVPMIGHGSTDIIIMPAKSIFFNLFIGSIINNFNLIQRKIALVSFSVFHIAQDFKHKYKYYHSAILHSLWLAKPIIAKLYLLFIHTPLHYIRIDIIDDKVELQYLAGLFTSIIAAILLSKDIDKKIDNKFGELWWVSPVITHIIITEMIKNKYIKKYKYNNLSKRLRKYLI